MKLLCLSILIATVVSTCQASFCSLFAKDGVCVQSNLPCPVGKLVSTTYNCGTPNLNCCYSPANPPQPPQPECGRRSPTLRIANGQNVDSICKWPWVVSIRVKSGGPPGPLTLSNTINICSGVLVKPGHVLTSANCLHRASLINNHAPAAPNLLVVAGETNTDNLDIQMPQIRERFHLVTRTSIHPNNFQPFETRIRAPMLIDSKYNREAFNIAMLKLNEDVELGKCREIACLPSPSDVQDKGVEKCYVASWGAASADNNPSLNLKEAEVELYPEFVCDLINYYTRQPMGTTCGRVPSSARTGICQGDDGAMVICEDQRDRRWRLLGLVNFPDFGPCVSSRENLLNFINLRNKTVSNWVERYLAVL